MNEPNLSITQVAFFFFRKLNQHSVSKTKMQSICYLSQGWWAAKTGTKLFREDFEAHKNGAISPALQNIGTHNKHGFVQEDFDGVPMSGLSDQEEKFLNLLLSRYGLLTGVQLSEKIRNTAPYADAMTKGYGAVIPIETMIRHYSKYLTKKGGGNNG